MDKQNLIAIRGPVPDDKNFVYSTWLRGLYYGDTWFKEIEKNTFMDNYHRILENLLAQPTIKIQIACLKEDPNVILGYSVSRGSVLDFVYVKSAWRRIGIAKSLMPETVTATTHLTKLGKALKPVAWVFNPFLM